MKLLQFILLMSIFITFNTYGAYFPAIQMNQNQAAHHSSVEVPSRSTISMPQDINNPEEHMCPICRENDRMMFMLSCKHNVCHDCLKAMLNQAIQDSSAIGLRCPLCRNEFIKHDLFNMAFARKKIKEFIQHIIPVLSNERKELHTKVQVLAYEQDQAIKQIFLLHNQRNQLNRRILELEDNNNELSQRHMYEDRAAIKKQRELTQERDALKRERDQLTIRKNGLTQERDVLRRERDSFQIERDQLRRQSLFFKLQRMRNEANARVASVGNFLRARIFHDPLMLGLHAVHIGTWLVAGKTVYDYYSSSQNTRSQNTRKNQQDV